MAFTVAAAHLRPEEEKALSSMSKAHRAFLFCVALNVMLMKRECQFQAGRATSGTVLLLFKITSAKVVNRKSLLFSRLNGHWMQ